MATRILRLDDIEMDGLTKVQVEEMMDEARRVEQHLRNRTIIYRKINAGQPLPPPATFESTNAALRQPRSYPTDIPDPPRETP